MIKNILITLVLIGIGNQLNAQKLDDNVLFLVDNTPVYVDEFKRVYNKNIELVKDESQKDIDTYLELFIKYKLKLKEARDLKLDEKPTYKREFSNYKKQLAKNYLTDSKVTEALVKEAYDRTLHEIKASHILIRLGENAPAQDTLKAYNALQDIRNKIINGEDFAVVAKQYSQDPSAAENGGNLGYFGGFRMVYDFESAAFNTPVGEVSQPFRTRFGYHIVKTFDKRKSKGQVTVAHIMISKNKKDTIANNAKHQIEDIYKKLQQGENFESLAKQFSEDEASAKKGGLVNKFGKGQLSSTEFEDAAFSLINKNDFSKPIQTDFGWHIIKLIDKHPVASYEEMKRELEVKVKRDNRSNIINKAFIKTLKNKYNVNILDANVKTFINMLNEDFYSKSWKVPEGFNTENLFFKIGNESINQGDFANYLKTYQKKLRAKKSFKEITESALNEFVNQRVLKYHEDNLEITNQEYAYVLNEYRDGLLLFDLMENQIWNAAREDSTGLKTFYNTKLSDYNWPKRIVATIASSTDKKITKKASKYLEKGWHISKIKQVLNKNNKVNILFTKDTMDLSHQALPKSLIVKKGISNIYSHNDNFVVVNIEAIIESKQKTFEEAKGKVISDYQEYIENKWLLDLREKYSIKVNNKALQKVKETIN